MNYTSTPRDARTRARRLASRALGRTPAVSGSRNIRFFPIVCRLAKCLARQRVSAIAARVFWISCPPVATRITSSTMLLARHVTLAVRGAARPFLATARGAPPRVAAVVPRCSHGNAGGIAVSLGPVRHAPTALSVGRFARRAVVSYAAGYVPSHLISHMYTLITGVDASRSTHVNRRRPPTLANRRYPKTSIPTQPSAHLYP